MTTEFIEIKLDPATLPKDNQWCEIQVESDSMAAQFSSEDQLFLLSSKHWFTAREVDFWKPLEVDWEFDGWLERQESIASLYGSDKFDNLYSCSAVMAGNTKDIESILEMEML